MQWCPKVAFTLVHWPAWTVYDLGALLSILGCESSGDPYWNEQNWGTYPMSVFGLFSHRRKYWHGRSERYLDRAGVRYESDQADDITVGVALYMNEGPWHWDPGCWPAVKRSLR